MQRLITPPPAQRFRTEDARGLAVEKGQMAKATR
jgi:hypothetical protein